MHCFISENKIFILPQKGFYQRKELLKVLTFFAVSKEQVGKNIKRLVKAVNNNCHNITDFFRVLTS